VVGQRTWFRRANLPAAFQGRSGNTFSLGCYRYELASRTIARKLYPCEAKKEPGLTNTPVAPPHKGAQKLP
jgi:hypothetical protein